MAKSWKFAVLGITAAASTAAGAHLQCVPYARAHSQVALRGNANTWWRKAAGHYDRGETPEVGAVLAFRGTAAMPSGHVAVVREIVDARHVRLDHANWSRPGIIEHAALAEDVSPAGDWSAVRVWHGPSGRLGSRRNPVFGFIYGNPPSETRGPWIHPENVFWADTRQAAVIRPENVALFEG